MADLRSELNRIRDDRGRLTPPAVVAAAAARDHPLHNRFEWDDAVAGQQFRLDQARQLIRSVRVEYVGGDGHPRDVRAFVSVQEERPTPEYVPVEEVAMDPLQRKLVLRSAEREWRTLKAKYEHLEEFVTLVRKDVDAA